MKNYSCIIILIFLFLISPARLYAQINDYPTLKQCYELALKQSEKIAIQSKMIEEAQGRFYQSLSGILPDISFVMTDRYQDGSGSSNFTLSEIPERKFTFSQPLFSGFKEFAAIAGSRAEKRQRLQEKKRAEELLFVDVVDAFYLFLSYQDQAETLQTIQKALIERAEELKKREELGRSRPSESSNAQARLSRVDAQLEGVLGEWEVARQLLEFLIGRPVENVLDEDLKDVTLFSSEQYLAKAEKRSDVLAAYESWQVAKKKINVAQAGFFPTVNADGNYYTKRTGNSSGVDWDVALVVDVPLFKGGENVGATKEAKAAAQQEELIYQQTLREAALEINNIYTRLEVAFKKEKAYEKAFVAVRKNYDFQLEDYQKNLVDNLEVLQALEDWQDAQQDYANAKNETKRLYWNLKASSGELHDAF